MASILMLMYSGSVNISGLGLGSKYTMAYWWACILSTLCLAIYTTLNKNKSHWLGSLFYIFISVPLLQMSLPIIINCCLDDGYSKIVQVKVIDKEIIKYKTRRGEGITHLLKIDLGSPYKSFRMLRVSGGIYDKFKKDDWIEMDIRPGKLGYPWVRSFRAI